MHRNTLLACALLLACVAGCAAGESGRPDAGRGACRSDAGRCDAAANGGDGASSADDAAPGDDGGGTNGGDGASNEDGASGGDAAAGDGALPTEPCNDRDDNENGTVDEGCACPPGMSRSCYAGPAAEVGRGICRAGTQRCDGTGELGRWGLCEGMQRPQPDVCANGMDDDCNGAVDDGPSCVCGRDARRDCYSGPAGTAGVGVCRAGSQTCDSTGLRWGACAGEVLPRAEDCANGLDDDCNGRVDDAPGCVCRPGTTRSCYSGPAGTAGVGACRAGTQPCNPTGTGWGSCTGEVLPRPEVCDNGVDDDCDGMADEGCRVCITAGTTPWQMHLGEGPVCWPTMSPGHGDPSEYARSTVPPETDPGWRTHATPNISFGDPSTLCGVCECRYGGDFTYFQTFFDIPAGFTVSSLRVSIGTVDDGVRVSVYNASYPGGVVDPGGYAYLGGGSTTDLARYIVPGRNRIVLTHVDDCCMVRAIESVTVTLNGMALTQCR